MIIGIAGKKGSGKDTIGDFLCENYGYIRYAFGDPVKDVCKILFGFNNRQLYGDKKEVMTNWGITPRRAFQVIGTEFGRKGLHELMPELKVDKGQLWIEIFKRTCISTDNIVITDVRFENEAQAIRDKGGIIIMVESKFGEEDEHESERADVEYNYLVLNNGTKEELYDLVMEIIFRF